MRQKSGEPIFALPEAFFCTPKSYFGALFGYHFCTQLIRDLAFKSPVSTNATTTDLRSDSGGHTWLENALKMVPFCLEMAPIFKRP